MSRHSSLGKGVRIPPWWCHSLGAVVTWPCIVYWDTRRIFCLLDMSPESDRLFVVLTEVWSCPQVVLALSPDHANTRHSANACLMLFQRLRRWANIKPTSAQFMCLLGHSTRHTKRWPNAGLMLGEHHKQSTNINPKLSQRVVFCWEDRNKDPAMASCWPCR